MENSWQNLLLRTDILQKTVVGWSGNGPADQFWQMKSALRVFDRYVRFIEFCLVRNHRCQEQCSPLARYVMTLRIKQDNVKSSAIFNCSTKRTTLNRVTVERRNGGMAEWRKSTKILKRWTTKIKNEMRKIKRKKESKKDKRKNVNMKRDIDFALIPFWKYCCTIKRRPESSDSSPAPWFVTVNFKRAYPPSPW